MLRVQVAAHEIHSSQDRRARESNDQDQGQSYWRSPSRTPDSIRTIDRDITADTCLPPPPVSNTQPVTYKAFSAGVQRLSISSLLQQQRPELRRDALQGTLDARLQRCPAVACQFKRKTRELKLRDRQRVTSESVHSSARKAAHENLENQISPTHEWSILLWAYHGYEVLRKKASRHFEHEVVPTTPKEEDEACND